MKVVAEEHPLGATRGMPRDGRRARQHLLAIGRQRDHRLHRADHLGHALQVRRRDKHRMRGEQIGTTLLHQLEQTGLAQGRLQSVAQRLGVQADAEAAAVQRLDRNPGQGCRSTSRPEIGRVVCTQG
ncbi:hypothetical protein D3C80_1448050 [compost metagenome]